MIVARPAILSDDWMLIGRQEITELGGRVDLLALAPDASVVLIELKRNQTPREVVAQAIDYAGWVERLKPEQIAAIYGRYSGGRNLKDDFRTRFGHESARSRTRCLWPPQPVEGIQHCCVGDRTKIDATLVAPLLDT